MTKKGWLIFILIVAAALSGAIYLSRQNNSVEVKDVEVNAVQKASESNGQIGDHTYGKVDSKVVLVEYGDFQCPGCGSAAPVVKAVSEKYKDKMLLIFRNRLLSYHQNARAAASFAEAAGLQGKYWEIHDLLYQNQKAWESLSGQERTDYFVSIVKQAGADATRAQENIENESIAKKITYDQALADKHGVTGTPSLFLNGKAVDQYVKDGKIVPKGTEGAQYIWSDQEAFDTLIIQPALKEAGLL